MNRVAKFPAKRAVSYPTTPTVTQRVGLPAGNAGIVRTLTAMRGYVDQYKVTPRVRELALHLVRHLDQKDYRGEMRALFNYVRDSIRYTRDIYGVETIQTPDKTLEYSAGDCDDKATLLCALLEAVGFETRFHAMGRVRGNICHVIAEARDPATGQWVALETTENVGLGYLPPGIVESIYYGSRGQVTGIGFSFSSITRAISKPLESVAHTVSNIIKTTAHTTESAIATTTQVMQDLAKGDIKSAGSDLVSGVKDTRDTFASGVKDGYQDAWADLKKDVSQANTARLDVYHATIPKYLRDLNTHYQEQAFEILDTPGGQLILSILSVIPVTAPFVYAVYVAQAIHMAEQMRMQLGKMGADQREQAVAQMTVARFVYDPAISAIRVLKYPSDENLQEYKYVNDELIPVPKPTAGTSTVTQLTPEQRKTLVDKTVAAVAVRYPVYAAALKTKLEAEGLAGSVATAPTLSEMGVGWGEAIGTIMTSVASQYVAGEIANRYAKDQMKMQLEVMNAQLAAQPPTPAVQAQKSAVLTELQAFTSGYGPYIMGAVGLLGVYLLLRGKRK